jgi:hypothetical protein
MSSSDLVWLAANYHFPSTYSCRVPMSSMSSGLAMPTPGPGTVRLALIRTGIELFGIDYTRDELFPIIRAAEIRIKPPERISITSHLIRGYKGTSVKPGTECHLSEAPIYREFAHATGPMTLYILASTSYEDPLKETLAAIGYWGQASSLTYCMEVKRAVPPEGAFAMPLKTLNTNRPIRQLFSCFASEFRDGQVEWQEILSKLQPRNTAIRIELYVWPLIVCERQSTGKILEALARQRAVE